MSEFQEHLRYQLVIQTPSEIGANDLLDAVQSCAWDFDIELAFSVSGKVASVGKPVLQEENSDFCTRRIEVDFLIDLESWETLDEDCYNARDTFDHFSASPKLPDTWEVVDQGVVFVG